MKQSFYVIAGTKDGKVYQRWVRTTDIDDFAFDLLYFGMAWSLFFRGFDYHNAEDMKADIMSRIAPSIKEFYHTNIKFEIDDDCFNHRNPFTK